MNEQFNWEAKLLGHNSSKTTKIYTDVSQKSLSKIISPLDKIDIK